MTPYAKCTNCRRHRIVDETGLCIECQAWRRLEGPDAGDDGPGDLEPRLTPDEQAKLAIADLAIEYGKNLAAWRKTSQVVRDRLPGEDESLANDRARAKKNKAHEALEAAVDEHRDKK